MDLRNLKTFISVAELASFTRAAQHWAFLSPPSPFKSSSWERELGIRLFERTRHAMKLTDQGREVLRYAYRMDKLTQDLAEDLHAKEEITGHVRLATADSLCSCLGRAFRGFWSLYPGISLKIVTAGTASLFQLLRHNEVDLVLTLDSHIHNSEYRLIRESQIGTHFVASPDCALCKKSSLSVEELLNYPFLLTEKRNELPAADGRESGRPVFGDPAAAGDQRYRAALSAGISRGRLLFSPGLRNGCRCCRWASGPPSGGGF